jgi:RNA polymerase sigma-70 factor (ECF subfamily)
VHDAALADDLVQDVWFSIVRQAPRYQPRARFRTWLFTLAHHRAIDCLRKSGREVSVDPPAGADDEPSADPWADWPDAAGATSGDPADQAFWRKAGQRLLHCLDGLPPAQRAVFLLHHEDGLSLDELARALGVSSNTLPDGQLAF